MENLETQVLRAWNVRNEFFPPEICFVSPTKTKAISVTGDRCEQNCSHCGGHYLKNMKSLTQLTEDDINASSWLISGGCTTEGKVPIYPYIKDLAERKRTKRFNVHTGLVTHDEILNLSAIADTVSFDFIGDNQTIREVLGTQHTVEDYVNCYKRLRSNLRVIPHICIGLLAGQIKGEYQALDILKQLGVDGLTVIVFTPTKDTYYSNCMPPNITSVVKFLAKARVDFPNVPLHLGCMRPGGSYRNELDQWAVKLGINTIVNSTAATMRLAEKLGLRILKGEECCSL
ncbi:radical SAM protein [Dendrosporobacter sp. 1207_IL3150]|uniref:radical SAM protein n=1 Tax=Dendrosporobacter sp. 1207_IL3150 TaxID=3084054 RepID=UPI002FDA85DB